MLKFKSFYVYGVVVSPHLPLWCALALNAHIRWRNPSVRPRCRGKSQHITTYIIHLGFLLSRWTRKYFRTKTSEARYLSFSLCLRPSVIFAPLATAVTGPTPGKSPIILCRSSRKLTEGGVDQNLIPQQGPSKRAFFIRAHPAPAAQH